MPNWCENCLDILNTNEDITKLLKPYFSEKDGQSFLDFEKIIPMPEGINQSVEDLSDELRKTNLENYGCADWYDWRCEKWGTKWNMDPSEASAYKSSISFTTAWGPPLGIAKKLAELSNHSIQLVYYEEGGDFCGKYVAHPNGTVVDICYDGIKNAPQELLDEIGYEPDEDDNEYDEE